MDAVAGVLDLGAAFSISLLDELELVGGGGGVS